MRNSQWLMLFVVLIFNSIAKEEAGAQFVQQGSKLVGTGGVNLPEQGFSVSISADGNTAIVGGTGDDFCRGAAWVFTRSGSMWSQQGAKLVGTGAVGPAEQGSSVSLSGDGNIAIVGGYKDNNSTGAAWVFTRSDGVWSQLGNKLVGVGAVGSAMQGCSVSLSADGNTAIVGGRGDSGNVGAAWVFTRSGGVWNQQGKKLVGTGVVDVGRYIEVWQGWCVSLSADGNTAIVGGPGDSGLGAAWVFTRSGGVWSQQGAKLVGTCAAWGGAQGRSVSLSADGNTALVGGYQDNFLTGAAWLFTRSEGMWSQQGTKLVGMGARGSAYQGVAVSLSADGSTAIVGGHGDNAFAGASWVFTRSGREWSQQGNKLVGMDVAGSAMQGYSVSLSADGHTAIVGGWGDSCCTGAAWVFARTTVVGEQTVAMPRQFILRQNYPNPFNPATTIRYGLPERSQVILAIFNNLGQEIARLVQREQEAGYHEVKFDGLGFSSGVYFYRLTAGSLVRTRRLVLVR